MTMFDAVVLGMGPGGEVAASRLLAAGLRVAVVERELIGGECAYWACIPSKTVLRPPEVRNETRRAAGATTGGLDWQEASRYRDEMIRHLDDAAQAEGYAAQGAEVVRGEGRLAGPGRVEVDGRVLEARHVIVATGSEPSLPEVPGAPEIAVWTNRETFTAAELPGRAVVVGGSAVGVETATFLAGFGVEVTLVHRGERLVSREEPRVGELTQSYLAGAGVDVRLGTTVSGARGSGGSGVVDLDDGRSVTTDVLVLATGRRPRTHRLGLEEAGAQLGEGGQILVDEQCRAAPGVWAVGDVTGIMPFTHVAKYQGRVVADAILGGSSTATYEGIPRVVFGEPEIAAVGLTTAQADRRRIRTVSTELDLAAAIARPWTYERDPRGHLGLLADADAGTLVGAWAVSPLAGEWIHQASLAIRAQIPVHVLRDQVPQFPTYHEAYLTALERLRL